MGRTKSHCVYVDIPNLGCCQLDILEAVTLRNKLIAAIEKIENPIAEMMRVTGHSEFVTRQEFEEYKSNSKSYEVY